mgnify:CR=1 FL=1
MYFWEGKPCKVVEKLQQPGGTLDTFYNDGVLQGRFVSNVNDSHIDTYGHLNNAIFPIYFSKASGHLLSELGFSYDHLLRNRTILSLKKASYQFKKQVPKESMVEIVSGFAYSNEDGLGQCVKSAMSADSAVANSCIKHVYGNGDVMDGSLCNQYLPLLFEKARQNVQNEQNCQDKKLRDKGLALVVSKADYTFNTSIFQDDNITICTDMVRNRNSLIMNHYMKKGDTPVAEARTKHGLVSLDSGRPLKMNEYI